MTDLDRIIADIKEYLSEGMSERSRMLGEVHDRLAALAGAAPVAWQRRDRRG